MASSHLEPRPSLFLRACAIRTLSAYPPSRYHHPASPSVLRFRRAGPPGSSGIRGPKERRENLQRIFVKGHLLVIALHGQRRLSRIHVHPVVGGGDGPRRQRRHRAEGLHGMSSRRRGPYPSERPYPIRLFLWSFSCLSIRYLWMRPFSLLSGFVVAQAQRADPPFCSRLPGVKIAARRENVRVSRQDRRESLVKKVCAS